jgi:VWFA-related protein
MPRYLLIAIPLLALIPAWQPLARAQEEPEPLESGIEEKVEVRFVILDALVLDRKGRFITDLTVDDFALHLDLMDHPITSVDINCPEGAAEEPKAVRAGKKRQNAVAPEISRRIVLAVDYTSLPHTRRIEVIDNLQQMVRDNQGPLDELMVVAFTRRMRVEQPFTLDGEEIVASLERMKHDPSLWMKQPLPHYDAFDLFNGMTDLIRMLRDYGGRKAIVLFSDLPSKVEDAPFIRPLLSTPAAFDYDRHFETISAAATDSRVAVYTVHASGLTRKRSSDRLARLALETGGRFTRNTNDLSLAYVRAQRDLACRYAIGFYDNQPDEDVVHRVNIKVKRDWARVIHPAHYRFGFDELARESLAETAYTAPVMFEEESVEGFLLPVRPLSPGEWEAAVAIRFPAIAPAESTNVVRFGAKLDDHAMRGVHAFDSAMTLGGGAEAEIKHVVVIEPAFVAPGEYRLSLVVNDPGAGEPQSAISLASLPELPKRGLFLVPPLLFQEAPENLAVNWSDGYAIFEEPEQLGRLIPLPPGQPVQAGAIIAVTHVCRLRPGKGSSSVEIERALRNGSGELLAEFPTGKLTFREGESDTCKQVVDRLELAELETGELDFSVSIRREDGKEEAMRSLRFTTSSDAAW